jgi:hypothetical protein
MNDVVEFELPNCILRLPNSRRAIVTECLQKLYENINITGILLGGSLSYKDDITKSDVDLFCLLQNTHETKDAVVNTLLTNDNCDAIVYQGFFPWTEDLYTIYFKNDIDFTIDIGLINEIGAQEFFWEPNGIILYDHLGLIEQSRYSQMTKTDYTKQPLLKSNPFTMAVISLKKIEKNLSRQHYWNAIDQVRNLRRYLMQVVRFYAIQNRDFLGRVDREIEDVMPEEFISLFAKSIPMYNAQDIAAKAIFLANCAQQLLKYIVETSEESLKAWITKHLNHEIKKLSKYSS